jgi:hypothetical protein
MGPDALPPTGGQDPKWPEGPEIIAESDISIKDVTTVKDMVERMHGKIDDFADEVDEEFIDEMGAQLKAKKNGSGYFICKNKYWDLLLQKFFAQLVSVKIWIIVLITVLLKLALITNIQFASILGIIMAFKGSFQVAAVWRKNGNGSNNATDKT